MVNIQSPTAEIRRGKKRKKKEEEERNSMKILWSGLLHRATIKNWVKTDSSHAGYARQAAKLPIIHQKGQNKNKDDCAIQRRVRYQEMSRTELLKRSCITTSGRCSAVSCQCRNTSTIWDTHVPLWQSSLRWTWWRDYKVDGVRPRGRPKNLKKGCRRTRFDPKTKQGGCYRPH